MHVMRVMSFYSTQCPSVMGYFSVLYLSREYLQKLDTALVPGDEALKEELEQV